MEQSRWNKILFTHMLTPEILWSSFPLKDLQGNRRYRRFGMSHFPETLSREDTSPGLELNIQPFGSSYAVFIGEGATGRDLHSLLSAGTPPAPLM
jgi:hypothetical protein